MKGLLIICILLSIGFAASCKPPAVAKRVPGDSTKESVGPLTIHGVVFSESRHEVVIRFSEHATFDPQLVQIMAKFLKRGPDGLVPINVAPPCKWLNKVTGQMASEDPQLQFTDLKEFVQLTVDLSYDSNFIESKTFAANGTEIGSGEQAGAGQPATRSDSKPDGNENLNSETEGRSR